MSEPIIAATEPYEVEVESGKTYAWCACGRSAKQPFCDGSHKGTGFAPVVHKPERAGTVFFCGCKRTGDRPFCDGSHETV